MHIGLPEINNLSTGIWGSCQFLGSRDAKTDEPFTCLVDEIFSQPQDFLYFAAHSAVFMPIKIFCY